MFNLNNSFLNQVNDLAKGKNTNAVSIGKKEKGGIKTSEVAVCFYVEEKKNLDQLNPEELIPDEVQIDGMTYKTDVKVRREVKALTCYSSNDPEILRLQGDPALLTPLKGGQEITEFPTGWTFDGGQFNRFLGTLGFMAVDNIDDRVVIEKDKIEEKIPWIHTAATDKKQIGRGR